MIAVDTRPGAVIDERFVIEKLAGSGGMGEVHCARDLHTGERVAVKVLHAGTQALVERFAREARLLSQLDHPGIVRYIAHGEAPPYLAMEWLDGEDLGRRLGRKPLELGEALELTRRIAAALEAAHRSGVIHRDIKPSNIFLCNGSIEEVKLLDFGVARALSGTRAMTLSGQVLGTIGYMAPEQAREGREVWATVDVFSLGCVLFECLAGRAAFPGDRLMAVLAKILFSDTPRVSDVRGDIPTVVDDLVLRMMQRRPEARPAIPALIAELDAIAARTDLGRNAPQRPPRGIAASPAITADEQRLMAIVLAQQGLIGGPSSSSPTLSLREIHHAADELARTVAPFGGRPEMLSNGAQLVILHGSGAATDLAAQAARCSLAMRRLLPKSAIAVVVGRGDPSVGPLVGDVAARAERLLEKPVEDADPRRIHLDPMTAGLLDARFEVRGEDERLELLGERERVRAGPVRELLGKPTPFVGRARELAMLEAALDECITEPLACAVVVTGPTGAGKSRLWHELSRSLEARGAVAVWTARGDAVAPGSAFGMLAQLLRGLAELVDGEPSEVRRQKLTARVARHLPEREVPRVADFLGEIVGANYPDERRTALRTARHDAALMGEQMLRAWEDFVAAECAAGPVLIVLEDLHWGDLPSVRFLDAALRALRASPLMVLALARPDVSDVFPDLWNERRVQALRLPELTRRAARELIESALGTLGERADAETMEKLVARAGGNPLYLEELIRAVAEDRADELPETVLAMAQARLEQLAPEARRLLRAASVFGSTFWVSGVAALLGAEHRDRVVETLNELTHRELVTRSGTSRFREEEELAFRHVVVRDAAYGMLTERDKQLGHKLAGAWLEAAGERDAIVMAEHLERGGEPGGAVVWYLWAAEQALEGNDLAAVVARAERGIVCGASGVVLGELLLLQAEALGWGARSRDHARLAAEALALLTPGTSAHARAAAELATASCRLGDHTQLRRAAQSLEPAKSTGPAQPSSSAMGIAHALAVARTAVELLTVGRTAWAEPLVAMLAQATASYEDDAPMLDTTRTWISAARALFAGRPERYVDRGAALAAAFESEAHLRCATIVELHLTIALGAIGAEDRAIEQARRTIELASRRGLVTYVERARAYLALYLARSGSAAEGEAMAQSCREAALMSHDCATEAVARAAAAAIRSWAADHERAERAAREVIARGDFPPDARADASATLALALIARGAVSEAVSVAQAGVALAGASTIPGAARVALAHVDALEASGHPDRARVAVAEAAARIEKRAAAIDDAACRRAFLAVPEHRALLERARSSA